MFLLFFGLFALTFFDSSLALEQCQKQVINYENDAQAIITGLFSIRESVRSSSPNNVAGKILNLFISDKLTLIFFCKISPIDHYS